MGEHRGELGLMILMIKMVVMMTMIRKMVVMVTMIRRMVVMVTMMINMVTMMTKIVVVGVWGNLLEGDNGEVWHWQGASW